jgi:DNA-binding protein H-NS
MTKTYAQIVKQIETLQQEAERIRRKETDGAISRVRELIAAYRLSAADLGFVAKGKRAEKPAAPAKPKAPKARKAAKAAAAVKFSNGSGGNWGGRGKRPQWLRDALTAGKKLSDFAVS